ncbi:Uncharacterised protein [Klebsiella pneumoniae]|nr:Uncharacterised protein [Klebsiella pneumoniae]SYL11093.1 Uncharacterised protein [Klebsiella pneumoniae]
MCRGDIAAAFDLCGGQAVYHQEQFADQHQHNQCGADHPDRICSDKAPLKVVNSLLGEIAEDNDSQRPHDKLGNMH